MLGKEKVFSAMTKKLDTEMIYAILKQRIIDLGYEPGQVLNELDLAEEFGASRTPIRRVFQMLSNDKLLKIIPRFGAQVVPIDFKNMKFVFEVTRNLDPFAARLATERITKEQIQELEEIIHRLENYDITTQYQEAIKDDERFHEIIYLSCGNPWLQDILKGLHYHTERLWHYSQRYFDDSELFTYTLEKVLQAIKEKNPDDAERYARDHIDDFVFKIKESLL